MGKNIEVFQRRWKTVTNETLSSVRRQLANFNFDNSVVNKDFGESCAEWFDGELAPRVWFQQLAEEYPEVAQKFKKHVIGIRISKQIVSKPSQWKGYAITFVLTILTLFICYGLLEYFTEMEMINKLILSIVTALLAWNICRQSFVINKENIYKERVVDLYRQQLDEHFKKIMNILS